MNNLESMIVEQTGLSRHGAVDLLESIFIYLKASVSASAAGEIDQLIAPVKASESGDLFDEAKKTFFGSVDTPSGLEN